MNRLSADLLWTRSVNGLRYGDCLLLWHNLDLPVLTHYLSLLNISLWILGGLKFVKIYIRISWEHIGFVVSIIIYCYVITLHSP